MREGAGPGAHIFVVAPGDVQPVDRQGKAASIVAVLAERMVQGARILGVETEEHRLRQIGWRVDLGQRAAGLGRPPRQDGDHRAGLDCVGVLAREWMAEHLGVLGSGGCVSGVPHVISADQDRIRVDRGRENRAVQRRELLSLKLLPADSRILWDDNRPEGLAHAADPVGGAKAADLVVDDLTRRMPAAEITKRDKPVGANLAFIGQRQIREEPNVRHDSKFKGGSDESLRSGNVFIAVLAIAADQS